MSIASEAEFDNINSHGLYGLAVAALQSHGDALSQIARQGRRLILQYEKLTQQILNLRQLFPPTTPEPADLNPNPEVGPSAFRQR